MLRRLWDKATITNDQFLMALQKGNTHKVRHFLNANRNMCHDQWILKRTEKRPIILALTQDNGRNIEVINELLLAGCNPNLPDAFGRSTLSYAIEFGDMAIIQLLLTRGAKPDQIDSQLISALQYNSEAHIRP